MMKRQNNHQKNMIHLLLPSSLQTPSYNLSNLPHQQWKIAKTKSPNAALLDCHYRLAEILNASGMAEIIESHLRDCEEIKDSADGSLREDGGTNIGRAIRVALWERVVG
jgi:hypothetical protein